VARPVELRRAGQGVDYVSVCSPNYLHDAHCRLAMRNGADVICEKPLTLSPWNLDALAEMERETGRRVWTVLQMRLHPGVASMRKAAQERAMYKGGEQFASLTYVTPRGPWYGSSWKGDEAKSGGILANIGIHMFDLLLWVYGPVNGARLDTYSDTAATGLLSHESGTTVSWSLAVDGSKPSRVLSDASGACDLSDGFKDAHTKVYAETLAGRGCGIADARPAVELVHMLRMKRKAAP
jgi:UDP-N-acetyl-2-amino-2-deoxyglucuronate dehydrogenase